MNAGVIISSFLSGLLSAMGLGGGSVLIIYLTSFMLTDQKEAQGINLLFFLATATTGVIGNIKNRLTNIQSLKSLLKYALPGMVIGFVLLPFIPSQLLKKLFGVFLLFLGIKTIIEKNKQTAL